MNNNERITAIKRALKCLEPTILDVKDDSARHRGHAGAQSGKGHFCLKIAAPSLSKSNLLQAHRQIYKAIGSLMETEIHALSITIIEATLDD